MRINPNKETEGNIRQTINKINFVKREKPLPDRQVIVSAAINKQNISRIKNPKRTETERWRKEKELQEG